MRSFRGSTDEIASLAARNPVGVTLPTSAEKSRETVFLFPGFFLYPHLSRSARFRIFPDAFFGSASMGMKRRGIL